MPTPPLPVTCDATPAPAQLPPLPELTSAADLPLADAWIAAAVGIYQREVTIRQREHACLRDLRAQGVIR